jgi:positive phototaxis protein PixI
MTSMTSESLIQTFLGFQLGSNHQFERNQPSTTSGHQKVQGMISTTYLAEILKLTVEDMIPIPNRSAAVMGVCNWRGEVLWLVDLGCVLQMSPIVHRHHPFAQYNVIIVKHPAGVMGLVVEQVDQMLRLDASEIQRSKHLQQMQDSIQLQSLDIACVQGYWQSPQQDHFLEINLDTLIRQLRA